MRLRGGAGVSVSLARGSPSGSYLPSHQGLDCHSTQGEVHYVWSCSQLLALSRTNFIFPPECQQHQHLWLFGPSHPLHDASSSGSPMGNVGARALHRAAKPHSGTWGQQCSSLQLASSTLLGCTHSQEEKDLKLSVRWAVFPIPKGRDPIAWSVKERR